METRTKLGAKIYGTMGTQKRTNARKAMEPRTNKVNKTMATLKEKNAQNP